MGLSSFILRSYIFLRASHPCGQIQAWVIFAIGYCAVHSLPRFGNAGKNHAFQFRAHNGGKQFFEMIFSRFIFLCCSEQ